MCDLTLKVGNQSLLYKLKCSILRRAILIGEITTINYNEQQLINPVKSEIGKMSKLFIENISTK